MARVAGLILYLSMSLWGVSLWADDSERLAQVIQRVKSELAMGQKGQDAYTVLLYGDPKTFPRVRLGREIYRLEKQFGRQVLALPIDNANDFKQALLELTRRKTPIENLFVRGIHGGTFDRIPNFEVIDIHNGDFEVIDFKQLEDMGVNLNLVKGAYLHFDSCRMVENSSRESIMTAFTETKRLGFKSGWIYLNEQDGASGVENTFAVPFYEATGGINDKLRALAAQASWVVTLPVFYWKDVVDNNNGYLYGESLSYQIVIKTHARYAEAGKIKGELVIAERPSGTVFAQK